MENLLQTIITRNWNSLDIYVGWKNDRKIKSVVFGRLEGTKKEGGHIKNGWTI